MVNIMKYGVIVCPKCKRSKAILLNYKTTKCNICNKILNLNKIKILYKTDSEIELRQYIGFLNKKLDKY